MGITNMNYYFTGILIILMCLLAFFVRPAHSGSTQTNTSGSNTAIEGGYTGGATTYESGSTSTSTTNSTSTSNMRSAPPTANSPSFSANSQDNEIDAGFLMDELIQAAFKDDELISVKSRYRFLESKDLSQGKKEGSIDALSFSNDGTLLKLKNYFE